jgi:hypothetical protein
MKNIDFLPDIYRQQRVQRSARRWWCLVAGIFAVALLAAASSQWALRSSLQRELAHVEPKYAEALQRDVQLQMVRQEIVRAEEVANLYAYLAHPWPRTQLLAAVIRPLPASIELSEITIGFETLPPGAPLTPASGRGAAKEVPSPAAKDLATVRQECDARQATLSITGTALLLGDLHAYVDQLGKSPLIAAAHLKGVESSSSAKIGEARFHIHVVVRPGYGQPGGPAIAPLRSAPPDAPGTHQLSRAALPERQP